MTEQTRQALEAVRAFMQRHTQSNVDRMGLDDLHAAVDALATPEGAAEPQTWPDAETGHLELPLGLEPNTALLVTRFANALADKLMKAQDKYGYEDGWRSPDWLDECRQHLREHLDKGDPRDVAAYCAFLWHHGASTATAQPQAVQAGAVSQLWLKAVQEAYGWLWHVNNEPMAPVPLWSPEKAAYEARKNLRDLLTMAQRGEAINAVRGLLENKAALTYAQAEQAPQPLQAPPEPAAPPKAQVRCDAAAWCAAYKTCHRATCGLEQCSAKAQPAAGVNCEAS